MPDRAAALDAFVRGDDPDELRLRALGEKLRALATGKKRKAHGDDH